MIHLNRISTEPPKRWEKKETKEKLSELHKELFELQNKFFADGRHALLIVLQGMDTSGKDGTIRHALACMNPMGIETKSFRMPTKEEGDHDFLWRIYPHLPAKGMISVFNRSHYEDVLVPTVAKSIPEAGLRHRLELINALERHWVSSGIGVLKFYLHIDQGEQKERLAERKQDPQKRWKYDAADDVAAKHWDHYRKAYEQVLSGCNDVPWNIIPANKRWCRNYSVAKVVRDHLDSLELKYPRKRASAKRKRAQ
ncbi:MAG: polyphosphate kinase [Flavobacteriales bacterium]|nr:polyphosphate kinase [Flavobacteriales bacterium]